MHTIRFGSLSLLALLSFSSCRDQLPLTTAYDNIASSKDTTVIGRDSDRNGVRDDVQSDLRDKYPDAAKYAGSISVAQSFQSILVLAEDESIANSPTEIQRLTDTVADYFASKMCIHDQYDFRTMQDMSEYIISLTINNEQRARIFEKANTLLSGANFDDNYTRCGRGG